MSSRTRVAIACGGVVLAVGACAYDWTVPADMRDDGGSGTPFAPDGSSSRDGGSGTPDGAVTPGGCRSSQACPPDAYCRFPDGMCGAVDSQAGVCEPRQPTCTTSDAGTTVCGCNGVRYASACAAAAAGVDVSSVPSKCPAPPNSFSCGSTYCQQQVQFCMTKTSEPGKCVDLGTCDGGNLCSCAISKSGSSGCTCTASSGIVRVSCP